MTDAEGLTTTYTYEDALGRTVCENRPIFRGALIVTSNEYNTANQLMATRNYALNENSILTPLTYTYFCYNILGQRNLSVEDMNLNNQIDWSDTDRIVSNDVRFVMLDGDWWRESSTWQTRQNGSPERALMGRSRTRLTGLGNGFVSETRSFDPLGNETTYAYDALGRQVAVTDPLGNTVTTTYDAEGRVLAQRGATYPVDYTYDAYGNKVSMTTYRNEADIPVGGVVPNVPQTGDTTVGGVIPNAPHAGDTTRWLYDEPSGCMTNKLYADGKGPSYSYTPDGKLARRTWARGIATDYTYDNAGQLVSTTYSDTTPTITMAYDRVGNLVNATTEGVVTKFH